MPKISTQPKESPSKKPSKSTKEKSKDNGQPAAKEPRRRGAAKPASKKSSEPEREICYPEIVVQVFDADRPMTREQNRKLMGWTVPPEGAKEGIENVGGQKVWLLNNQDNRLHVLVWIDMLKQEILNKKWKQNGQPTIVGKTGKLLNGQHTSLAFELACQEWEKNPGKWKDYWPQEPTMERIVIFGIDEDDETVNTIDFVRPRSLADVIYRSECFKGMKRKARMICARMTSDAIKTLWLRTGASHLTFGPKRTHSESMDFLNRHPKVLDAVKHIYHENGKDKLSRYISSLGYLAGLLYLFGCSATEREKADGTGYAQLDVPLESALDWQLWDRAQEFFVMLAQGAIVVHPLIEVLGKQFEEDMEPYTLAERTGLVILAWDRYAQGEDITEDDLVLEIGTDGEYTWIENHPLAGGIDLGPG